MLTQVENGSDDVVVPGELTERSQDASTGPSKLDRVGDIEKRLTCLPDEGFRSASATIDGGIVAS